MIEPKGPLPQSVYWRRRALAAVGSVLAVALLAWLIGGLVGADDQHPVRGTASASEVGDAALPATARVTSTHPSSTVRHDRGSVPASPPSAGPTSGMSRTTAPAAACQDAVTQVVATPDVPSYPVGARPLLRLRIVNAGPVPCARDVSRKLREILVLGADGARLWSSNDCYGPPERDVRLLPPEQSVEFSVNWAGRTSAPGCPLDRRTLLAGTY